MKELWEGGTALSAIDFCCQAGNEWDVQLTHGNSEQRRKTADRNDLDSLVKTERGEEREEKEELFFRIIMK